MAISDDGATRRHRLIFSPRCLAVEHLWVFTFPEIELTRDHLDYVGIRLDLDLRRTVHQTRQRNWDQGSFGGVRITWLRRQSTKKLLQMR